MTKTVDDNIIVGLDIGTATVSALVGEILPDGQINIIGAGSSPSRGMDKGGVNDLESVVKSVQRAIDQAEMMAECKISHVFLSISGRHIASRIEKGMGTISDEEVSQEIWIARSIQQNRSKLVKNSVSACYSTGVHHRLSGRHQESAGFIRGSHGSECALITCHNDMARNIIKAVERCGLKVEQLVYSGLAASNAVITEDERELGVCVVDIGAGTMDIAIWTGGALRHTEVFSYAGNAVTSDIAFAFGTPVSDAEEIKVKYGCALSELVSKDDTVNVPSVGGRPSRSLQRQTLSEVIEPRYTELMGLVNQTVDSVQESLRKEGIKHHLAAGVVLTGGAAQIEGLVACAERVFRNQVRVGKPLEVSGLTDYVKEPYHSTAVGLLHYARDSQISDDTEYQEPKRPSMTGWIGRLRNWIQKEF
ncbi:cell division protein FtsA [Vibrio cholerae CT 5369-93]|nr:cell division protein FtsA [Vibrio cholerae CT 5369-93]